MKKWRILLLSTLLLYSLLAKAQDNTLTIGIPSYVPPYVMQSANHQLYGFDVEMMQSLCKLINKTCQFKIMKFDQLIDAVATNEIDMAVGTISITTKRKQLVFFSNPYLPTYAQFLGLNDFIDASFSFADLAGKRIGVKKGSIFDLEVKILNIPNPHVITFQSEDDMLEALSDKKIDYILVDELTAVFWQNQSANVLIAEGQPFEYGDGLGIAITPQKPNLVTEINQALAEYKQSNAFNLQYDMYLKRF